MTSDIAFVTFGMFIIDEIEYMDSQKPQQDLIGGAGTYAALGARIVAGTECASGVSWIVDIGSDFPLSFKTLIDSWETSCMYRTDLSRLTTRAWNGYGANEHRSFKYLTPKIRLEVDSLTDEQALAKSFHMVCSSSRCQDLATKLKERRKLLRPEGCSDPVIIWEPIPDLCTPAELQSLQVAASMVAVVSPNADELSQFFGPNSGMSQDEMVHKLIGWNTGKGTESTLVVIREGADGSTIYYPTNNKQSPSDCQLHLSAFHTKTQAQDVVDPTGGGNTYLGALAMGLSGVMGRDSRAGRMIDAELLRHGSKLDAPSRNNSAVLKSVAATIYAVVAASYAIEQSGVPKIRAVTPSSQYPDGQCWNNDSFLLRLESYLKREHQTIIDQLKVLLSGQQ